MNLANLTKRDAYFVGYADAYQKRIIQIDRENKDFETILEKWPDATHAGFLRQRIRNNEMEKRVLSAKVSQILANVRS